MYGGPSQKKVGPGRGGAIFKYSKNIRINESYIDMLLLKFWQHNENFLIFSNLYIHNHNFVVLWSDAFIFQNFAYTTLTTNSEKESDQDFLEEVDIAVPALGNLQYWTFFRMMMKQEEWLKCLITWFCSKISTKSIGYGAPRRIILGKNPWQHSKIT